MALITDNRKSGIELLRLLLMLFIISYHFLGVIRDEFGCDNRLLLLWYTISHIGVPVFILVSGYFSIKLSLKKILHLWLYCVIWYLICFGISIIISNGCFSWKNLMFQFMPFSHSGGRWFIPFYFSLMLLSPILNLVDKNMTLKQMFWIVLGGLVYCLYFDIINRSPGGWGCSDIVNDGHSLFYFMLLYIVGRFVRKVHEEQVLMNLKWGG